MYDLTNLSHAVAVFEIDDDTFHGHAKFMHYIDTQRAMGNLTAPVEQGMGHWEGVNSTCYVMSNHDFVCYVADVWTEKQDAILHVDTNGDAFLKFSDGRAERGRVEKVDIQTSGGAHAGFTILKSGTYVVA